MPTKPPVATVSPSWMSRTASAAVTTLPGRPPAGAWEFDSLCKSPLLRAGASMIARESCRAPQENHGTLTFRGARLSAPGLPTLQERHGARYRWLLLLSLMVG